MHDVKLLLQRNRERLLLLSVLELAELRRRQRGLSDDQKWAYHMMSWNAGLYTGITTIRKWSFNFHASRSTRRSECEQNLKKHARSHCTSSHCCFSSLSLLWPGSTMPPTMTMLATSCSFLLFANHDTRPVRFFTLSKRAMENRMGFLSCKHASLKGRQVPAMWMHRPCTAAHQSDERI